MKTPTVFALVFLVFFAFSACEESTDGASAGAAPGEGEWPAAEEDALRARVFRAGRKCH